MCRLAHVPLGRPAKAFVVRAKHWPKALYGCEVAPVSAAVIKGLRSSGSRAIFGAQREFSCNALVLNVLNQQGTDPKFGLFWMRFLGMRQVLAWFPDRKIDFEEILKAREDFSSGTGLGKLFRQVVNELGWEISYSDGWKVQRRVGFFWFYRVCILRLKEIFVEDFRQVGFSS